MRDKQKKRLILIVSIAAFVIIGALTTAWIIHSRQYRNVAFYYPNFEIKKMSHENRSIFLKNQKNEFFESDMIEDYLLGPRSYDLRLPLPEDVDLKTAWVARGGSTVTLVLDFNSEFSRFAGTDNDNCRWVIQGIIDTLQKNTRVQKLQILVGEQQLSLTVGTWNLMHPIPVRPVSRKK